MARLPGLPTPQGDRWRAHAGGGPRDVERSVRGVTARQAELGEAWRRDQVGERWPRLDDRAGPRHSPVRPALAGLLARAQIEIRVSEKCASGKTLLLLRRANRNGRPQSPYSFF